MTFDAFGAGLRNLQTFDIIYNNINNIDPEWIVNAENLDILLLGQNLCVSINFRNIIQGGINLSNQLRSCTNNFLLPPTISCRYQFLQDGSYACVLASHNPNGFNGFEDVPGDHLANQGDEDLTLIDTRGPNTQIIPTILCQKFENLRVFFLMRPRVEFVDEEHFKLCANLEEFYLVSTFITTVPDFTFRNSPKLREFYLDDNEITSLSEFSFAGTNAEKLNFMFNYLTSVDQKWFEVVNSTLKELDLYGNWIDKIATGGFT